MTARVSMLLKSRASLTCFRACFLPGRAKDLSASRYKVMLQTSVLRTQPDTKAVYYGVDRAGEHIFPTPHHLSPHPAPYFVKQTSHRLQKCGVPYFDLTVSTLPFVNRTCIEQSFGVTHKLNFVEIG